MTPTTQTPCVIYCRVSTKEQGDSGLGLDAQEFACRAEAERRGWVILEIHHEVISGDKAARPLFDAACSLAKEHSGVLLTSKADRVSRGKVASVLDLHERASREGWAVYAMDMPEIDTTAPMGEFIITILAAIARLERRMTGQRTKDALAAAKRRGVVLGRPRAMPEATLSRLRELRAEGLSLRKIADAMNAEGSKGPQGGQWWDRTVRLALINYGTGGK